MTVKKEALFSSAQPVTVLGKIIQFPFVRILVAALFLLPFLLIHNTLIADFILSYSGTLSLILTILDAILSFLILLGLYSLYTKWIEKRKALEFSLRKSPLEFAAGALISLGLVGVMVLLMSSLGYYAVDQIGSPLILVEMFFIFGVGAFVQVLIFRIILFRLLEEVLGTWISIILVMVIFGVAHIGNPNADLWSAVSLILGDILLVSAFILTRRLWFVWGIHFAWNFFQDGVFGMPNSGITDFDSWIQPVIQGPSWITGGSFGIEASWIALFLSVCVGLFILFKSIKKDQIVKPLWIRK